MPVLRINCLRHYFRLEGPSNGLPLVLTHPIGADHSVWDAVVPELPQFHVLRYDLRGHGGTAVADEPFTLAQLADDLLALTQALGIARFSVAGVSLGALVAAQAAATAPGRVRRVVLCSTAARLPGPPGGWDGRARQAVAQGMAALAPGMMARMFQPGWLTQGEPLARTLEQVFRHTDPAGYAAGCAVLRDADLRSVLPDVRAPTLVVTGVLDALLPPVASQRLLAAIPHSRGQRLPTGHYPMVEQPQHFAEALTEFLAGPDDLSTSEPLHLPEAVAA
jgi:3-oxoadipate enol-lactonase